MRLLRSQHFGVLAILAGVLTPLVSGQSAITWGNGFWGEEVTLMAIFTGFPGQSFVFTMRKGISVTRVGLFNGATAIATGVSPATTTTKGQAPMSTTASPEQGNNRPRQAAVASPQQPSLTLQLVSPTGTIIFNSTDMPDMYAEKPLYFQLNWTESAGGKPGSSYSQAIVYISSNDSDTEAAASSLLSTMTTPVHPETTYTASLATSATAATTTTPITATTATAATTTAPASTGTSNTTPVSPAASASAPSEHRKKNGLAGGAIAGIVIGVLALLAIVGAAFFFYRRRQAHAGRLPGAAPPYRGSGSEQIGLQSGFASAAVVEKDGFVGASTAGAHSPYTDDDGAGGAGGASSARDMTETVPTAASALAAHYAAPAPAVPAAAAKPAVNDHVAALIEDHMTSDDVARLAAEERELDEAIETALRNRTARQVEG